MEPEPSSRATSSYTHSDEIDGRNRPGVDRLRTSPNETSSATTELDVANLNIAAAVDISGRNHHRFCRCDLGDAVLGDAHHVDTKGLLDLRDRTSGIDTGAIRGHLRDIEVL